MQVLLGRSTLHRFFSQLHTGIAGPDDVYLHSTAHMPQFAHETSERVCIQEFRCVAEFWHITEECAEDGFCKGSLERGDEIRDESDNGGQQFG